jgi:hypothetical protein
MPLLKILRSKSDKKDFASFTFLESTKRACYFSGGLYLSLVRLRRTYATRKHMRWLKNVKLNHEWHICKTILGSLKLYFEADDITIEPKALVEIGDR